MEAVEHIHEDESYVVLLRNIPGLPCAYFRRHNFRKLRDAAILIIAQDLLQTVIPKLLSALVENKPVTRQ